MTDTATRAGRRADMVFGGIWLVFLVSPITALIIGDASPQLRITGAIATALFAAGYLISYLYPTPGRLGTFGGAVTWTAVLTVLVAVTIPAIGPYALAFLPFLVAISVFRLPAPWDLVSALVPVLVTIALLLRWSEPPELFWQISISIVPIVIMVPIRRVSDGLDRQASLREELALSRQREQVGRDVHDILGHSLTVIAVKTDLASKLVERDPERARAELEDVLELTRSSLGEVRATVTQLQIPHLGSQLAAAETALDAAGIRVERPTRIPEIDDARSELLAWCLREAVTNVVRHSDASRCIIKVAGTGLTITDDGVGQREVAEGHGLRGMRERVTDAGGTIVLSDAKPGAFRPGTRLEVAL